MNGRPMDPETLAALLDGRLTGERREAALAALASDEAAYEAYVDAVAVTRELEAEGEGDDEEDDGPVRSIRTAPSWWRRYGTRQFLVAAGLAALVVLPYAIYRSQDVEEGPAWVTESWTGSAAGIPAGWNTAPWGARRSVRGALTPEARATRVGARLVDLEVSLRAGDSARAAAFATEVADLLDSLPAAGPAVGVYRNIAERASAPRDELDPLLARGRAAAVHLLDEDRLRVGAWLEAARLAAAERDADFLRATESRDILDRLRSDPELSSVAGGAATRAWTAIEETPVDWSGAATSLSDLLGALGRA